MPIQFAKEPQNGSTLVNASLAQLSTRIPSGLPPSLAGVNFGALSVQAPHAIFDLQADAITQGKGLASARATGFRYPVEVAGVSVAAAEVHADASGSANLVANINCGPFVAASAQALNDLAKLAPVNAGQFEACLLRFSAIPLMAIWLKSTGGASDLIYPLEPAPSVLVAGKLYSESDFLKAVMPIAQKRVASGGSQPVP